MAESNLPSAPSGIQWWLRRADQATVAALILFGLGAIVAHWVYRGGLRSRVIQLDAAPPIAMEWQVDVNSAEWPELSVLPEVGDQLAREIVENRRRLGPFFSPADLRRVHGMGPKTVARITPFLAPFPSRAESGTPTSP
jgi:competence protein ComEA